MQIVVTGAAGFIGRQVVAYLAQDGAEVVAIDSAGAPDNLPDGVEFVRGDAAEIVPEWRGEFVLAHLAWYMDRSNADAQAASVEVLLQTLGNPGLHGVVGMGSAEEYGEREGCLNETMAPGTRLSAYGWAKVESCRALRRWAETPGNKAVWLRPFIAYGPGQSGSMAIPYAIACARERHKADFSEGLQGRDFVHVHDVARGIAMAARRLPEITGGFTICNMGCGKPVRLRDVLARIARNFDAEEGFHFGARPMRVGEPAEQYADLQSVKRLLGWEASIPWEQGIDALCETEENFNHR
ncbi:MAG: NAD(P)-dependent oxidoreductase [Kiritimatiellae bacterium]|nr:NAD(P)-dependent oxidoreductase [Kiritimatiellia bacterium]